MRNYEIQWAGDIEQSGCNTVFSYGGHVIWFLNSPYLEYYTSIKEWDDRYMVTSAKYSTLPEEEEEYIDLLPNLENLYFDPQTFLKPIKDVKIQYV